MSEIFENVEIQEKMGIGKRSNTLDRKIYTFRNPCVIVSADPKVTPAQIYQVLLNQSGMIERDKKDSLAPRMMSAADAYLVEKFSCHDKLVELNQVTLDPPLIYIYSNGPSLLESFNQPYRIKKIDNQASLTLRGRKISFGYRSEKEVWSSGQLITGAKTNIPGSVIMSLKGKPFGKIIEGSIFSNADLVINNAWNSSGRLGVNFTKSMVPVSEIV